MPYPVAAIRNRNFGVALPFMGAYDAIPSIVAAYGMRRLRTAYTGSILRIRESIGNTEQDIGALANGDLDTAAIATFIGGGSGYFVKWYDQSGNAYDASQTTATSQPLYVASGQNGRPVGRWDGVNDWLDVPNGAWPLQNHFILCCFRMTANTATKTWLAYAYNFGALYMTVEASNHASFPSKLRYVVDDIVVRSSINADTNFVITAFRYDSVDKRVYINAADEQTVVSNTGAIDYSGSDRGTIGAARSVIDQIAGPALGDIAELIICNAALSDANRQLAEAASNNYWAVY